MGPGIIIAGVGLGLLALLAAAGGSGAQGGEQGGGTFKAEPKKQGSGAGRFVGDPRGAFNWPYREPEQFWPGLKNQASFQAWLSNHGYGQAITANVRDQVTIGNVMSMQNDWNGVRQLLLQKGWRNVPNKLTVDGRIGAGTIGIMHFIDTQLVPKTRESWQTLVQGKRPSRTSPKTFSSTIVKIGEDHTKHPHKGLTPSSLNTLLSKVNDGTFTRTTLTMVPGHEDLPLGQVEPIPHTHNVVVSPSQMERLSKGQSVAVQSELGGIGGLTRPQHSHFVQLELR